MEDVAMSSPPKGTSVTERVKKLEEKERAAQTVHPVMQQVLDQFKAVSSRMSRVRHKVAVMSGKGGVGKSSATVNLALCLARLGKKVGILDVDISGPCIPKMMGIRGSKLTITPEGVQPVIGLGGVKIASMDLLVEQETSPVLWKGLWEDSAAWRGTVEMSVIRELIADVAWGDLDILLIDMPPASSDKPPVIAQLIPDLAGAIIVTIPSEISQFIVRKSVMFLNKELKIPMLGLIENMSGAVCPHCGEGIELFENPSGSGDPASILGLPLLGRIPFDKRISTAADRGESFTEKHPATPAGQAFVSIAAMLSAGLDQNGTSQSEEIPT
jgi:ATP-binding protein involved in chromosome partitioning